MDSSIVEEDIDLGEELLKLEETKNSGDSQSVSKISTVGISAFLRMEFPPRKNLLDPWLPTQGICMVYGERGIGKTYVAIGIAIAVASGGRFLKWDASEPKGVLLVDGEMPAVVLQERLAETIASMDDEPIKPLNIITPDLQDLWMLNLSTTEGQAEIEPHLKNISLVIVDTISTLCGNGRENDAESWEPIQEWALKLRTMGISVLFMHHAGKGGLQRGTSKREDVLDTVIKLKHPTDYTPEDGAYFEVHFEKARGIYGDDVKPFEAKLTTGEGSKKVWTMKDLEESLIERVAKLLNDEVPQKEIPEKLGKSKGYISKLKTKAKNKGLLQ